MLALAGAVVPVGPARAASGPFSIDGVVPDTTPTPPQLSDAFGNVKEIGPVNSSTTKIGVIQSAPTPMLALTNPNAQVDLRRAWLTTAKDSATGHDWLYFAWERDSNSGSGFIAYEFMQNAAPAGCAYGTATDAQLIANCNPWANRRAGDFMILWDQSGSSTALVLRTWSADSAGHLTLGVGVPLNATVSQAAFSPDGFRGEAAVDLTATIFGGSNACKSFANTIPSTVTGNSDSADYKDTILQQTPPITNCTATITTTPKTSAGASIPATGLAIGSGAVGVMDSAVVGLSGGTATPSGSVSFTLCKVDAPATCSTGGTTVGSTSLTGGTYPATVNSPTAYVTSAGRYCWRSSFSGDTANGISGVSESSSGECFTVNPATPAVATTAGPTQLIGQPVTDSASLTGTTAQPANPVINLTGATGPAAGGTITFLLYGPSSSGCGNLVYTSPTVAVHGDGSYPTPDPQFVPTQAGTYHWVANYSGSSPNTSSTTHNTLCDDTAEDVTVTTVASTLSTAQTWVPNDSITVSAPAGGTLAGTAYFDLFGSSDCSGTALYSTSSAVGGLSPQTVGTANTTAQSSSGPYSWRVRYDSTNPAQRSIPASCLETSALTVVNGGSVSSP
ncbi:MAG: hypothetical protein JWQ32_45 [Marmoricola sp.]|nr:hypothetical protein [Marmoricola sp.]